MKLFIALSAVVLAASALPAERLNATAVYDPRVWTHNIQGFATLNGGTRGGAGGAVWTVWDAWALRDALLGNDPRIIYVRGRIDLTVLFTGSPGVSLRVGSFKTIFGGDRNAEIYGGGLKLYQSYNVIIQNIKFTNSLSYAPGEQPNGNGFIISQVPGAFSAVCNVDIDESWNVLVDHNEFSDDPWNALATPENQRRHNGLVTVKRHSTLVTISNNIFRNHNMNLLIGHADDNQWQDEGRLKVTLHSNWFQGIVQRSPLVRFGEVHVYNNLYTDNKDYCIGIAIGANVYAERNVFTNSYIDYWLAASNLNPAGRVRDVDNMRTNTRQASGIPVATFNPSSHYQYSPLAAGSVEWHVRNYAGIV